MAAKKVNFTLPRGLVRRIRKLPLRKKSELVKQAIEKELDRQDAMAMLGRMWGKVIWKVGNHPDLLRPKDFARYRVVKGRAAS